MRFSNSTLLYAYITFWLTNGFENTNLLLRVSEIHDRDLTFKFTIHPSKEFQFFDKRRIKEDT